MNIPPDFEADVRMMLQLQDKMQQDPSVGIILIQGLEQIVSRLQPNQYPDFYAYIQALLGAAYQDLKIGDRGTNLERAISCYQQTFRFYTPETKPLEYAAIQMLLGRVYSWLPTGDRAANLESVIAFYQ